MDDQAIAKALAKDERRRKKAELDRQMAEQQAAADRRIAELAAQKAAMGGDTSDSDAASPPAKSPVRKRKSDVLAEASPVKQKGE
jgi:hypothetical protein